MLPEAVQPVVVSMDHATVLRPVVHGLLEAPQPVDWLVLRGVGPTGVQRVPVVRLIRRGKGYQAQVELRGVSHRIWVGLFVPGHQVGDNHQEGEMVVGE